MAYGPRGCKESDREATEHRLSSECRQGWHKVFQRLQGSISFLPFSSFQRLPAFLGSPSLPPSSTSAVQLYKNISLTFTFCLLLPSFMNSLLWTIQRIQDNFPSQDSLLIIIKLAPLPCKVIYSQVLGIRIWSSLGGNYCVHHSGKMPVLKSPSFWKFKEINLYLGN